jgi:excisionase family DNA binding protein
MTERTGALIAEIDRYPDVLLVEEVAAVLRLSAASVYRAVRRGSIPALRVNRRVLIPKRAVLDLVGRSARRRKEP